jgi:BioD-like phosphotransacetylase family protein
LLADRALAAQDYFGTALLGVMINEAPRSRVDFLKDVFAPYLARHNLHVLGILPKDPMLAAPTVAELADGLHAEILCNAERKGDLVEQMMVGAMGAEAALIHFRRIPNKAVITGGDRADIQLAALETSTRCLILTGNLYPSPVVLNRADELGVPVLLADLDTLKATEVVEGFLGRGRVQLPQKIDRFTALPNEHFDFGDTV